MANDGNDVSSLYVYPPLDMGPANMYHDRPNPAHFLRIKTRVWFRRFQQTRASTSDPWPIPTMILEVKDTDYDEPDATLWAETNATGGFTPYPNWPDGGVTYASATHPVQYQTMGYEQVITSGGSGTGRNHTYDVVRYQLAAYCEINDAGSDTVIESDIIKSIRLYETVSGPTTASFPPGSGFFGTEASGADPVDFDITVPADTYTLGSAHKFASAAYETPDPDQTEVQQVPGLTSSITYNVGFGDFVNYLAQNPDDITDATGDVFETAPSQDIDDGMLYTRLCRGDGDYFGTPRFEIRTPL